MKSDEDVRMISAEAPVLFAKACEFFILELTMRAWSAAEEHKRRTLQRNDIATAVSRTEIWDFLLDTVPHDEAAAPEVAAATATAAAAAFSGPMISSAEGVPGNVASGMGTFSAQQQQQPILPPPHMGQMAGPGMIPPGMPLPPGSSVMCPPHLPPGMFFPPGAAPPQFMTGMPPGQQIPMPLPGQIQIAGYSDDKQDSKEEQKKA